MLFKETEIYMLAAIGEFFAFLMKGCYSMIPNYGLAIIFFTLLSKII